METRVDHLIVGGGIIGLSTAWNLARRGQQVLLLERFEPGHTRGASHGATRNMNNAYTEDYYLDLYDEALQLWRVLERESGEQLLTLCGLVSQGDPELISEAHAALTARGAAAELLCAEEATSRWPGMKFEGTALLNRDAGRIHSARALEVLAALARANGAELRYGQRVTALRVTDHGVEVTAEDHSRPGEEPSTFTVAAPSVIVAAGAWSQELLRGTVELPPLQVTEEHPAHFQIRPHMIEPGGEAWWPSFNRFVPGKEDPQDGAVYGMLTPGEGVKVGFHKVGDVVDPDARRFRGSDLAREALRSYVAEWFPGLDPDTLAEISCTYTSTADGRFVLDRVGAVTVAAGFSGHGFKFAPAIGRILADSAMGISFPPDPFRLAAH